MPDDLEMLLRPPPGGPNPDPAEARTLYRAAHRRARRDRRLATGAVALVVVAVGILSATLVGRDQEGGQVTTNPETPSTVTTTLGPAPSISWREIDTGAPVEVPQGAALAASATTLLIWGGDDADGFPAHNDGTLVDLATAQVRTTTPAPTGPRRGAVSRSVDDEFLVLGGGDVNELFTDGVIYDPRADGWRTIGPAPLSRPFGYLLDAEVVGDRAVALFQSGATGGVGGFSADGWELCGLDLASVRWTGCRDIPVPDGSASRPARAVLAANEEQAVLLVDEGFQREQGVSVEVSTIDPTDLELAPRQALTIPVSPSATVDSLAGAVLSPDGTLTAWGYQETAANEIVGVQLPFPASECPTTGVGLGEVAMFTSCGPTAAVVSDAGLENPGDLPGGGRLVQAGTDHAVLVSPAIGGVTVWISETSG